MTVSLNRRLSLTVYRYLEKIDPVFKIFPPKNSLICDVQGRSQDFFQAVEVTQNRAKKHNGARFFKKQGKPHKNERKCHTVQGSPPPGWDPDV